MPIVCHACLAETSNDWNGDIELLGTEYVEQEVLANGAILWKTLCTKNKVHLETFIENPKKHVLTGCSQKLSKEESIVTYSKQGYPKEWIERYARDSWQTRLDCSECGKKNCEQAIEKHYGYRSILNTELATYDPKLLFHEHGLGEWHTTYPMHPILRKHKLEKP